MIYAWKCKKCGYGFERPTREPTSPDPCPNCGEDALRRDWRAEGANVEVFISALGEGKVQARTVKPDDDVSRTGPMIGGAS